MRFLAARDSVLFLLWPRRRTANVGRRCWKSELFAPLSRRCSFEVFIERTLKLEKLIETDGDELENEFLAFKRTHEPVAYHHERHRRVLGVVDVVQVLSGQEIQHLYSILNIEFGVLAQE